MKIEEDGKLTLHLWDMLVSDEKIVEKIPEGKDPRDIYCYSYEARIAAAYSWAAGYTVFFVGGGTLVEVGSQKKGLTFISELIHSYYYETSLRRDTLGKSKLKQ